MRLVTQQPRWLLTISYKKRAHGVKIFFHDGDEDFIAVTLFENSLKGFAHSVPLPFVCFDQRSLRVVSKTKILCLSSKIK